MNNDDIYKKLIDEIDAMQKRADARHQELQNLFAGLFETLETIIGKNNDWHHRPTQPINRITR